jgi:hypothetical protein
MKLPIKLSAKALERFSSVLVCLFFLSTAAKAESVVIGSDHYSLNIPKGYCFLKPSEPSDSIVIKFLNDGNKGINKVIMSFADCGQLKLWRAGDIPNLNDFGYILVPTLYVHKKINISPKKYLFEMDKLYNSQGSKIINSGISRAEALIEKHLPSVKVNETKNLGVLSKDSHALYWGLLQHLNTDLGKSKHVVGLMAMSFMKGKPVNFYLWKEYLGNRTIYDLEQLTALWVTDIQAAN